MNAYGKMLKNVFDFNGRTTRRDFWIPFFINGALVLVLYGLIFLGATVAGDGLYTVSAGRISFTTKGSEAATLLCIPWLLVFLYVFIVQMGLTIRRLHDAGIPGWVYPICLVGTCMCGIGWIVKIVLCSLDSKPDNKWGPNPKMQKAAGMPQMNGMQQMNVMPQVNGIPVEQMPNQPSNVPVAVSGAVYALAFFFTVVMMVANYNLSMDHRPGQVQIDIEHADSEEAEDENNWNPDESIFGTEDASETDSPKDVNSGDGVYRIYLDIDQTMEAQIPEYPGFRVTDYDEENYIYMEGENTTLWDSCSYFETKDEVLEALNFDSMLDEEEQTEVVAAETTVNGNTVYYNKCVDMAGDETRYHMYVDLGMQYFLEIQLTTSESITDETAFAMASFDMQ